jgi:hypothetical protein
VGKERVQGNLSKPRRRPVKSPAKPGPTAPAPAGVDARILELRGVQVLLDSDLAEIYGVTTSALNQAVKRNASRFPEDFRFRLTPDEFANLKSQSVTSSGGYGGRRKLPWAVTEHGAIMAATVLSSPRAPRPRRWRSRPPQRLRSLLLVSRAPGRPLR